MNKVESDILAFYRPFNSGNRWGWYRTGEGWVMKKKEHSLPTRIHDKISKHVFVNVVLAKWFETYDDAMTALKNAIIELRKERSQS